MYEDIRLFGFSGKDKPFSLAMSGISYCDGSYRIYREKAPITVIEYINKGSGTVIFDGNSFSASEGDVYILKKDHKHEYYSSSDDPWVKTFFNINGDLFPLLLEQYGLGSTVLLKDCKVGDMFGDIFNISKNEGNKMPHDRLLEILLLKLHELVINISRSTVLNTSGTDEMITLKNYIDANPDKIIGNGELAAMIYRSKDYTVKKFRESYGRTPYDYQLDCKLSVAKRLLSDTALSIRDISERLGYSDQHYFSNLFKEKCGVTPSAYRKSKN